VAAPRVIAGVRVIHRKEFSLHRDQLSRSIVPYMNAARAVITDTSHLVVIFVAVLVVVDLLGAVVWIYLKRFFVPLSLSRLSNSTRYMYFQVSPFCEH